MCMFEVDCFVFGAIGQDVGIIKFSGVSGTELQAKNSILRKMDEWCRSISAPRALMHLVSRHIRGWEYDRNHRTAFNWSDVGNVITVVVTARIENDLEEGSSDLCIQLSRCRGYLGHYTTLNQPFL